MGQFVQARFAQERAATGNPGVVFEFEFFLPFFAGFRIFGQEFFELDIGIDAHAAEFVTVEFLSMTADAAVLEYDGTRRVFVYPEENSQEYGTQTDNSDTGTDYIEQALDDTVVPPCHVIADLEGYDVPVDEGFHIEGSQGHGAHIGNESDIFDFGLQPVYDILHLVIAKTRCYDKDMLDTGLIDDGFGISKSSQMGHEFGYLRFRLIIFQKTDEIIGKAGIILEIFQHNGGRLSCSHDKDRELQHMETVQYLTADEAE